MSDFILETRGLSKSFGAFKAVNGVDLCVRKGTIHALIGPNGAGKSTVFNLLTKFLKPSTGKILFNGRDITHLDPSSIALQGMVRSFQISAVFPQLTVRQNVRVALQRSLGVSFHFWRSSKCLRQLDDRATELIESVNLGDWADRTAGELPYGRKRALEIATTLALDPELILLDEPLAGMGREDIARTADLIKSLAQTKTVIMVEHNLSVVADISDRITVLRQGSVLAEGTYDEVSQNRDVVEAYMGTTGATHG